MSTRSYKVVFNTSTIKLKIGWVRLCASYDSLTWNEAVPVLGPLVKVLELYKSVHVLDNLEVLNEFFMHSERFEDRDCIIEESDLWDYY